MEQPRKIKKFTDFVPNIRRVLNQLVFKGKNKGSIFSRSKDFEVQIYYTPLKMIIVEIKLENIESDTIPFKVGDNISIARKWCNDNKYEIILDIKKL